MSSGLPLALGSIGVLTLAGDLSLRRGDARAARHRYERDERLSVLAWTTVIADATAQVLAEDEPVKLREELVVLAATALAWIEAIDRGEIQNG